MEGDNFAKFTSSKIDPLPLGDHKKLQEKCARRLPITLYNNAFGMFISQPVPSKAPKLKGSGTLLIMLYKDSTKSWDVSN